MKTEFEWFGVLDTVIGGVSRTLDPNYGEQVARLAHQAEIDRAHHVRVRIHSSRQRLMIAVDRVDPKLLATTTTHDGIAE